MGELLVLKDVGVQVLVLLFNGVRLLVQQVHVVVQAVVLLFRLDKGSHDLLYVLYACSILDLVEGVFDDLGVAHVLVEELLLLLVGLDHLAQAQLQDGDGVGELSLGRTWAALSVVYCLVE